MKTRIPNSNLIAVISLIAVVFAIGRFLFAAEQKQAHVTEIVHDVKILGAQNAARPAVVNDAVHEGTAVRTGTESRAELTFNDQTLTRLGANTVFSFNGGARAYDLGNGAILMSAPKSAGTLKISTAVATCAISGFTLVMEYHLNLVNKVLVPEGDGSVWLNKNPNDPRPMHSGQLLAFDPKTSVLPQPVEIDVCKLINAGYLFNGFKTKLASWPLLLGVCEKQHNAFQQTTNKKLLDPTSTEVIDQAMNAHTESPAHPTAMPTIIPSSHHF
jgi:hypothetical protein